MYKVVKEDFYDVHSTDMADGTLKVGTITTRALVLSLLESGETISGLASNQHKFSAYGS